MLLCRMQHLLQILKLYNNYCIIFLKKCYFLTDFVVYKGRGGEDMNKRITAWFVTAMTLILLSDYFVILASAAHWGFGSIIAAAAAGLTLPLLLGVIGTCLEVRMKKLFVTPILSVLSLAVSIVVYFNIPGHMWFPSIEELIGAGFVTTCFITSAVILVISGVHAIITKKKRYDEFLAESRVLFPKHNVLWTALLAAVSGVSILGYAVLIMGAIQRLWDI